jgi:hypothetical protein
MTERKIESAEPMAAEQNEEIVVGAGCGPAFGQSMMDVAQACGFGPASNDRMSVIGAPMTTVAASAAAGGTDTTVTITVSLRGGNSFLGRKLLIPAEYAASVLVKEIWCDATNIMSSNDPLPGELFSTANPDSPDLQFLPVGQNSTIKVVLTNQSSAIYQTLGLIGVVSDLAPSQCSQQVDPGLAALAAAQGFGPNVPCKMTVLGAPKTTLASAATTLGTDTTVTITVSLRGGRAFLGRRLIIPKEIAAEVRVKEVWCDATPILQSNDPIPGEVFASDAQIWPRPELQFVPVSQNSTIRIVLTNDADAHPDASLAIEGVVFG